MKITEHELEILKEQMRLGYGFIEIDGSKARWRWDLNGSSYTVMWCSGEIAYSDDDLERKIHQLMPHRIMTEVPTIIDILSNMGINARVPDDSPLHLNFQRQITAIIDEHERRRGQGY